MRRRYETIAELQEVCKEYNLYSAFESKLTRNMAFKTACEKGFAGIVIFYFDHRRELLNKALINEGREIARENGCDEIISLFYDYTGQAWSDKVKGLIKFKNKEILVFTRVSLFFDQF